MVDYCLVPFEELANIENVMVRTMSQCEAHLCVSEEGLRVPDHSVLMWDLFGRGPRQLRDMGMVMFRRSIWFQRGTCWGKPNSLRVS